jgi:hypothetical protein
MKKAVLALVLMSGSMAASAQCVPNPIYQDSVYGAWPDTTENFASGQLGIFYSDTLYLLVPNDAGLIDPNFDGYQIDSVALNGVSNLPPGITVICNSQTPAPCTFLPNQVGCGLLEGTPTQAGTYEMTVDVTAYSFFFGFVVPVPQSFEGYRITIDDNVGVNNVTIDMSDVRNTPNPFANRTSIEFGLNRAAKATVRIYNLVGEKLWEKQVDAKQGMNAVPFDASNHESGIYLYKVEAGGNTFTGRMVLNH